MCDSKQMVGDLKPIPNKEAVEDEFALNLFSDVTGISKSQLIRHRDGIDPIPHRVASDFDNIAAGIKIFDQYKIANTMQLADFLKGFIGLIR